MLADVVPYLRCPHCAQELSAVTSQVLGCAKQHTFDIAKHGYVSLLAAPSNLSTADDSDMVAARAEFLAGGHFQVIAQAISQQAAIHAPENSRLAIDIGAGTGYYLAQLLASTPIKYGAAVDNSKIALRRAAKSHPNVGAICADVWHHIPFADHCAQVVLNVFAPRNGAEFHRILATDGVLVVVRPTPRHLAQLVNRFGLVGVDDQKGRRVHTTLGDWFTHICSDTVEFTMDLTPDEVRHVVAMGPSSKNPARKSALAAALADVAESMAVTSSVQVGIYAPRSV